MTFKEWCKQHQNEDTRIGDIASDILRDENFPDSSDYKVLYSYIKSKTVYSEVFAAFRAAYKLFQKENNNSENINNSTTEKKELIMVGRQSMVVPNAETVERLARVKKHLLKQDVPFEQAYEFDEMINALESAICILDCARKSFESHKDESLKIQDIIKSCDGFITFKEWLGLITSDSNYHMEEYEKLLRAFAWDDDFPLNSDSTWKSYRMLLKYIMKKWNYKFWDDFKKLYYEYQNILEGRWFP